MDGGQLILYAFFEFNDGCFFFVIKVAIEFLYNVPIIIYTF